MAEKQPMIVALAAMIASRFPDLGGRCIAVSETNPFNSATVKPTLPMAFTALVGSTGTNTTSGGQRVTLDDDVILSFMFEPTKYKNAKNQDTPFFAFYDYEPLRDAVLTAIFEWRTPRGSGLVFRSMDVASDEFAVYITFNLRTSENWEVYCQGGTIQPDNEAQRFELSINTHSPRIPCCIPECEETDPCPPTVKPTFTAT